MTKNLTSMLIYSANRFHTYCPINMVTQHEWAEINKLLTKGLSVPQVSEICGRTTTTLYHLISTNGPKVKKKGDSKKLVGISRFEKLLKKKIKIGIVNGKKLLRELNNEGYNGSYATLNRYLKINFSDSIIANKRFNPFKNTKRKNLRDYKRSIRFETNLGEQAQVDWGSFGRIIINGKEEKLSAFVFTLSYSRVPYIEFVIKQNLQTLIQCHINAFTNLGVPKEVIYDNMKTVVIRREKVPKGIDTIHYKPEFLDFAKHYHFTVATCPPYWPRAKGKVEATIKFLRNNFMQGMKFGRDCHSLEELNRKVKIWIKEESNRIHGTVGVKPIDRLKEEKLSLRSVDGILPYQVSCFEERRCTKDAMVNYKYNFYSVPDEYARKRVFVKELNKNGSTFLEMYFEDKLIAEHTLRTNRGNWILEEKHYIKKIIDEKKTQFKKKAKIIVEVRPLSYYDQLIGV